MSNQRRNYIFRTPGLLKQGFYRNGVLCWDSHVQILANSKHEADTKFEAYKEFGKKIGWYK